MIASIFRRVLKVTNIVVSQFRHTVVVGRLVVLFIGVGSAALAKDTGTSKISPSEISLSLDAVLRRDSTLPPGFFPLFVLNIEVELG